jgi:hypothetical protein
MWTCAICKAQDSSLPLCFGAEAPWRALASEAEFDKRVELSADQCVVDGEHFFVRGHVELLIVDTSDIFAWSVWCSLSEKSFRHMTERWEDAERDGDAYFGWLSSAIPAYPSTIHLKTNVRVRAVGLVPLIEIQECEHPLYMDQRDGVTLTRVHEFVHTLTHDRIDANKV